jgi:gliding motility associated protien GldN
MTGSLLVVFALFMVVESEAQQRPRAGAPRKATSRPSGYTSGYTTGNAAARQDTTRKRNTTAPSSGYTSGYGSTPTNSGGNAPLANVPIEVKKGGNTGIGDSVMPSLRTDNAIDRNLVKNRTPLEYEHIREDDAVYKQRVWREIDTREKMNLPFRYAANEDNGNQRFISILFDAIQSGNVTAFSGEDDRFTTPLTKEQVAQSITGGLDTIPVTDLEGNVVKYEVRQKQVEADSIYRYRLKEEWIFDKESSRMHVRILGIAPIMMKYTSTGIPIGDVTLFWAYYPDLRPTLAQYEVYNGKNYAGRMSWEELFESRFFSSFITKSTLDNPFDRSLKEFIKDPLFRLLEGENIKEKIFNYEQDLWSY